MNALDLVSSIGSTSGALARTVGPKRGLIGLATFGALVGGGIILAKYLKRRALETESMELSEKARDAGKKVANGVNRRLKKVKATVEPLTY